jgi:DNA-binding transcriptional MerR regulator
LTLPSTASVPIPVAAARAGVSVEQIRRWADIGGLEIQRRGSLETVRLDRVMALSASARRNDPSSSRAALRARLADAADSMRNTAEMEQLARERSRREAR